MSEDFDASRVAARAVGEDPPDPDAVDVDSSGDPSDPDGERSAYARMKDLLMSTDPDPPLEDVEDPYDPERGGTARIYRGIMKMAGVDGLPAIGDLLMGVLEAVQNLNLDEPDDSEDVQEGNYPGGDDVL